MACHARHPVEVEEDNQPDSPLSTSRLRNSLRTPSCSSSPVSHRARKQPSKEPHRPYLEASHRNEDHREQASESTYLALKRGGLPPRGCRVDMRVRGGASWRRQRTRRGRRGVVRQRCRWRGRRWRGCGRWRQRRRGRRLEPLVTVGAILPRPHCEALVWSGPFLLRANWKDEQPEPEQHEYAVQALQPPQRHPAFFAASRVLLRARLVVRERVLDVGVPDRARIEELLERRRRR